MIIGHWHRGEDRARPASGTMVIGGASIQMMRSWAEIAKLLAPELTANEVVVGANISTDGIYFLLGNVNDRPFA